MPRLIGPPWPTPEELDKALPRLTPEKILPVIERLLIVCEDDELSMSSKRDVRDVCYAFIALASGAALAAKRRGHA